MVSHKNFPNGTGTIIFQVIRPTDWKRRQLVPRSVFIIDMCIVSNIKRSMTCLDPQKAGGNKTHFIDKLKPTSNCLDAVHKSKSLRKKYKKVLSFLHQRNSTMLLEKKQHMHTPDQHHGEIQQKLHLNQVISRWYPVQHPTNTHGPWQNDGPFYNIRVFHFSVEPVPWFKLPVCWTELIGSGFKDVHLSGPHQYLRHRRTRIRNRISWVFFVSSSFI